MNDIHSDISSQWRYIQQRFELVDEIVESLDAVDVEFSFLMSNLLDELVILLANFGIEIRKDYRQMHTARQMKDDFVAAEQQWLESLMGRG